MVKRSQLLIEILASPATCCRLRKKQFSSRIRILTRFSNNFNSFQAAPANFSPKRLIFVGCRRFFWGPNSKKWHAEKIALETSFPTNPNMTYFAFVKAEIFHFKVCDFKNWKFSIFRNFVASKELNPSLGGGVLLPKGGLNPSRKIWFCPISRKTETAWISKTICVNAWISKKNCVNAWITGPLGGPHKKQSFYFHKLFKKVSTGSARLGYREKRHQSTFLEKYKSMFIL